MINKLDAIILQKKREVIALHTFLQKHHEHPITHLLQGKIQRNSVKSFKKALSFSTLAIIAEIKRKSPSKGAIAAIPDPEFLAHTYINAGANALSVLTDEVFFDGNLNDLARVAITHQSIPILRKDFIIDESQIAEAIIAGADAILCIVKILGKKTKLIINQAKQMNIDALVEVHDMNELDIALSSGAEIIGINNRNLKTLQIDTQNALRMLESIPSNIIRVAESGILDPKLAREYFQAGFNAVLIGEGLIKCSDPKNFIKACRYA